MKIDLSCPAEVWKAGVPDEKHLYSDVMLYNLCDKTIVSAEVSVHTEDADGKTVETTLSRSRELDGRPAAAFSMRVPLTKSAVKSEAVIEKLWFTDSSIWRRGSYPMTEYESNALPNGPELDDLRFVGGSDCVGYPAEREDCWLCVCGRPNAPFLESCARCRRLKHEIFTVLDHDAVAKAVSMRRGQLEMKAKIARENDSRMQLEREKVWTAKRKKRRRVLTVVGTLAAVGVLAFGGVNYLAPYLRYRSGVSAMESGRYTEALSCFQAMPGYMDADSRALRCSYHAAAADLSEGSEASLLRAQAAFAALGEYEDAPSLKSETDYRLAELYIDTGRPDAAEPLLAGLSGYGDSAALTDRMHYAQAQAWLNDGNYPAAEAAFTALGEYEDAPVLVRESIYRRGMEALEAGDTEDAIAQLTRIPGYKDADDLLWQAWYVSAEALEAEDPLAAGRAFLNAGDYSDAKDRAVADIQPAADAAFDEKRWPTAAELYALIAYTPEGLERYRAAAYAAAGQYMTTAEYGKAYALLCTLPDDYEETLEMRQEAIYAPSLAALESGDWEAAIAGFSQISTYRDSADRLQESRYWLAMSRCDNGDWAGAVELLEQTGRYSDSVRNLQIARYNLAGQYIDEGRYEEAEALFTLLGDYRDSSKRRQETIYLRAGTLQDPAAAMALYQSISGYSDADEKANGCAYALAEQLAETDREAAARAFAALGSYGDAAERAAAIYTSLGEEAEAAGQIVPAGRWYQLAGDSARAEACFDAYFGVAAEAVTAAIAEKDYPLVITLLNHMNLTDVPEKYAALGHGWNEANYALGKQAWDSGDVYSALPYWRAIPGYADVDSRLQRSCYRILGAWTTADGRLFVFRNDGTCTMDGSELYFSAQDNALLTGSDPAALKRTHSISELTDTKLELRIIGSSMLHLTRTEEPAHVEPEAETTHAVETTGVVTDEDEEE